MKKIIAIALLTMFGLASKAQALSVSKTISSTTFVSGFAASDVLLLQPRESLTYGFTNTTATGTLHLERSFDGSNWTVIVSSVNLNNSGSRLLQIEYADPNQQTMFRFRASTMTGAGTFAVTLTDNDDFVAELRNNKKLPIFQLWDDTIRFFNFNKGIVWNDVIPSTATDSTSAGNQRLVYLTGTVAALEGSVVVATAPVAGKGASVIVAPGTANLTSVFGVAAEPKAVNNSILVYTDGIVNVLSTGTIVPGAMVGTSASAGYVQNTTTVPAVGLSLSNGISAGGILKILLGR